MQSITLTFTKAATGKDPKPRFSVFWMMLFAIVIMNDNDRREKKRRKKRKLKAIFAKANRPGSR